MLPLASRPYHRAKSGFDALTNGLHCALGSAWKSFLLFASCCAVAAQGRQLPDLPLSSAKCPRPCKVAARKSTLSQDASPAPGAANKLSFMPGADLGGGSLGLPHPSSPFNQIQAGAPKRTWVLSTRR